jgi:hypothetical protein
MRAWASIGDTVFHCSSVGRDTKLGNRRERHPHRFEREADVVQIFIR